MNERIFAKPREGIRCPKAGGGFVKPTGEWMEKSVFVRRRMLDGDLIECDAPPTFEAVGKVGPIIGEEVVERLFGEGETKPSP